ncbi:hypothetical protein ES704_01803 [subsurface metagenome]|jgi:predicted  nucleic acid-binding Zn-ribbon protein
MNLEQKLEEAKAKRKEIVEQVNVLAEEIERLREQRQALLQEALRFDGECRLLEKMLDEERQCQK